MAKIANFHTTGVPKWIADQDSQSKVLKSKLSLSRRSCAPVMRSMFMVALAERQKMLEPKLKVAVDYDKCHPERCDKGICAAVLECPTKLWKQEEPYDFPYPIPGFCQDCGICVESCPLKAIRML